MKHGLVILNLLEREEIQGRHVVAQLPAGCQQTERNACSNLAPLFTLRLEVTWGPETPPAFRAIFKKVAPKTLVKAELDLNSRLVGIILWMF